MAGSQPPSPQRHEKYERLVAACRDISPIPTAVAHPCDASSLGGAVDAARQGFITPILIGPAARIRAVADESGLDIAPYEIVDVPDRKSVV